tara:strand:- start:137 stop:871 length:735 start_codon:yes stop_codon:yes gene_type:complete
MTNPSGKRANGRLFDQSREFQITWDPMEFALSSVTIQTGRTSVLCSVCIEEGVPSWRIGQNKGWLSAEYRLLPGSTPSRQKREILKLSGRTQEIQRLIGRTLRATLDMTLLGERTLLIDCDVVQADAGTRTAAITGSWIALSRGLERLVRRGSLPENPLRSQVAAISVGLINGLPLLDLDYSEDSIADVDLNVVMDANGNFLEIQGSAERLAFSRKQLNNLLDLAQQGITGLHIAQLSALKDED